MRTLIALTVLGLATACSGASGPEGTAPVTLQLASAPRGPAAAPQIALGDDVLVVESVQLVARKIRLGQASGACVEEAAEGSPDEAECPLLKLGPVLLEPPVVDGAIAAFSADLPAGSYDRLRMQVHKPTGSADRAFLEEHPTLDGVSIRVTGTYNDAPFTFTTSLTVVEEIRFEEPVEVVEGAPTDVTLLLDVAQWFVAPSGSSLLNPAAPDQQARSRIEQNIRRSFKAFRDQDRDARSDG